MKRKIKQGSPLFRAATFDNSTINAEQRTVEMSFSSEEPYERYFGWETLDHSAACIRMGRLNDGGAFLLDHNTRDQIGVVEKAWISPDRKGRALVRFGRSARAEEILNDVADGIRRNTSVGYDIHKMILEKTEGDVDFYRVTDWEPLEISLVSVPADVTVGVGRDLGTRDHEIEIENQTSKMEGKKEMEKCSVCGTELINGSCPACARATAAAEARAKEELRKSSARVEDILAMGRKHDLLEDAQSFIREGKSVEEFKDFVIDRISTPRRESVGAITAEDQPIYRGSAASMLGAQLLDIRTMSAPGRFSDSEVRESRGRLEKCQNRHIKKMEERAKEERAAGTGGFTIGVPSDGGFFLQGETVIDLMTNGFNNSEILPKAAKRTLTASQFVEVYGIDETSRANGSRSGGIRVYTTAELDALTQSKTKFNMIRIEPKKLTGLFYASGEWMRNVTFLGQEVRGLFGDEFAFKCQDLAIRGGGAGEALGILNADCLVPVPKETGQAAKTILAANLSKMWARFTGRNPVWFINRDCGPQLDELSIPAGTGALEPRFVSWGPDGVLRIKGAPVIEIEQCETLGTVGDIILADWSQYICADQGDIEEAMSTEVNFIYDQGTYRFIYFFDGQPRWRSAITPFKGSNTVSPFVALASRA